MRRRRTGQLQWERAMLRTQITRLRAAEAILETPTGPGPNTDAHLRRQFALLQHAEAISRTLTGEIPDDRSTDPTPTGHLQNEEAMSTLTNEIKEFIVIGLARYDSPQQVAMAVKETFDVVVSRQQVHAYDPEAA